MRGTDCGELGRQTSGDLEWPPRFCLLGRRGSVIGDPSGACCDLVVEGLSRVVVVGRDPAHHCEAFCGGDIGESVDQSAPDPLAACLRSSEQVVQPDADRAC